MRTVKGYCLIKMELVSSARNSSSFEALSIRFFKLQKIIIIIIKSEEANRWWSLLKIIGKTLISPC
jgi:hypothetical protein